MQFLRNATVLLSRSTGLRRFEPAARLLNEPRRKLFASSTDAGSENLTARVLELVKKYDKIDSSKIVTERSNFRSDLSLDSLDMVELIMAIEQEFSVEIPDNKAQKLSCCADVVKYIAEAQTIANENS